MMDLEFTFSGKIWMYQGKGAWFFVTIPKDESEQIKFFNNHKRRGWGSVRVAAKVGKSEWKTSIFPDSKVGAYLLPIKADIRKKEKIVAGNKVRVTIQLF
ncbi:MAG: DUF1905 domain-containing protein [Vampirovibrio sp.]